MVIIAGPNGAGKTTVSQSLLGGAFNVAEFVNADVIAKGLLSIHPESAAIQAGRIMLRRIDDLSKSRITFACETTLASRSFVKLIEENRRLYGYECYLIYLWLPTPEMSVARVKNRAALGGHFVSSDIIRRRYYAGLSNFFNLYRKLVDGWKFIDNSQRGQFRLIAEGAFDKKITIHDSSIWIKLRKEYEQTIP